MINRIGLDRLWDTAQYVFEIAALDDRQMVIAVADEAGGLLLAARMDRAPSRTLWHATLKAYTSAIMQRDTITFRDQDRELGKSLADWGDTMLTHLVGGVSLRQGGEWLGGLGVGGNTTERDGEIAVAARRFLLGES